MVLPPHRVKVKLKFGDLMLSRFAGKPVFGAGSGFAWLILLGIVIAVLIIVAPLVAKKMIWESG